MSTSIGAETGIKAVPQGTADVRFGSKADMATRQRDVRFTPNNGHSAATHGSIRLTVYESTP
jgi:hypothetical protein